MMNGGTFLKAGALGLLVAVSACGMAADELDSREHALVTFDLSSGTGFVGKGDVQLAFGWNNAQLQTKASGVTFHMSSQDEYRAVCTFITGEGTRGEKVHDVSHKQKTTVNSAIAYDARVRNQITGFILKGFGATDVSGDVPTIGGACPGNAGHEGVWTSVDLTSSSGTALYVSFGGVDVQLVY